MLRVVADWIRAAARGLARVVPGELGGPVDRRHPREDRALATLAHAATGRTVSLVAATAGEHHAGAPPGFSTRAESGLAYEGARAGDVYRLEVLLRVPGWVLRCQGAPRAAGVALYSRTRFATRAEAAGHAAGLRVEAAWRADGGRLAVRILAEPGAAPDWHLVEFAPSVRWGVAWGGEPDAGRVADAAKPFCWHDAVAEP